MITYIELAIAIISLIFTIISTYLSFKQSNSNPTSNIEQRILQINPIYFVNNNYTNKYIDDQSIDNQNKSFMLKCIYTIHLLVIVFYYIFQLMECFDNEYSLVVAIIKTIILISLINIFYSLFILFFFKNNEYTVIKNLIAMKYYSLKVITDIILIAICTILMSENFINNTSFLLNMTSISLFDFIFQITWFFYTLQKSFKLIEPTKLYKEKLIRLIYYIPSYLIPFVMFFFFLENII